MILDRDITKPFAEFIQLLNRNEIPYMIVGSVASIIYGEPRLTHDMDLVIQVQEEESGNLARIFLSDEFYCPDENIIRQEIRRKGQFNIVHNPTMYKFDMIICKSSLYDQEAFKRRTKILFWENTQAVVSTPEDVIIKKLEFYRKGKSEKHLRDIASILRNTEVDQKYIDKWIATLSLQEQWKKMSSIDLT